MILQHIRDIFNKGRLLYFVCSCSIFCDKIGKLMSSGNMSYKPVTHVLFDMDGLLLNTEDLYTMGFEQIASRYGKKFTFELKCKIMGQQSRELAGNIIKELDLPLTIDEFLVETRKIFIELFPQSKVMPACQKELPEIHCQLLDQYYLGVQRLLVHLNKHKIPVGLATSSSKETYDIKVSRHKEFFSLLPYKTNGSDPDVKRGKPSPDIFLVAAAKFPQKPAPDKCLVFEDSLNGVRAAVAAGMQVVLVPDPRFDRSLAPEATLVLNSMEDFRPEIFGLPPFDK